jgi:hypothetical protein
LQTQGVVFIGGCPALIAHFGFVLLRFAQVNPRQRASTGVNPGKPASTGVNRIDDCFTESLTSVIATFNPQ